METVEAIGFFAFGKTKIFFNIRMKRAPILSVG
jgi:hypothetical protein